MRHLKTIIIWIAALFLILIVVSHSHGRYKFEAPSKINYKIPYSFGYIDDNKTAIRDGMVLFFSGKYVDPAITADVENNVKHILKTNPLSSDALAHIAAKNMIDEGLFSDSSNLLLQESIRRNGRNSFALGTLLYGDITRLNLTEVFKTLENLVRLRPESWSNYSQLVNNLYALPDTRTAIMNELEVNAPIWAYSFFVDKIPSLQIKDVAVWDKTLRKFLVTNEKNTFSNAVRAQDFVRQIYPNRLVALGEYKKAYEFVNTSSVEGLAPNLIMNTQFEMTDKKHPFGWRLISDKNIMSEYDPIGGLFVSYNSLKRGVVLSQYAVELSREPMMISFDYDFRANDQRGHFEWQFACAVSGEVFFVHKIDELSSKNKGQYLTVPERPQGCEFIKVTLSGVPGDYINRLSIMLNSIDIRKA